MTASFHSASAPRDIQRPKPVLRQTGALVDIIPHFGLKLMAPIRPLVLFSESGDSTYAATFLQALLAIPQIREAITRSVVPPMLAENGG